MKRIVLTLTILGSSGALAAADEPPAPPDFQTATVVIGAQQTSVDTESSKFSEYREVPDGLVIPYFRLLGQKDGWRYDFKGENARQDDEHYFLSAKGGSFSIESDYNRIPHNFGNNGRTLERETAPGVFTVSDTLQRTLQDDLTANRSRINYAYLSNLVAPSLASANEFDLSSTRERGRLVFKLSPSEGLDVRLSYFRERKLGTLAMAGTSFGFGNVIEIPEPLHYLTQDVGAEVSFRRDWGNLHAGVHVNLFDNEIESLSWDNPFRVTDSTHASAYTGPSATTVDGPSVGRTALYPDNRVVSESIGGTFKLPGHTRLSADVVLGQWSQNSSPFIPYTTNTSIDAGALPAQKLDGKVATLSVAVLLSSRPADHVSLTARYRYYDFDNQTPRISLPHYVRFDAVLEDIPRISVPYAYSNQRFEGTVAYDFGKASLEAGYRFVKFDRTFRETQATKENAGVLALVLRPRDEVLLRASYERASRDPDGLDIQASEGTSYQHPEGIVNLLAVPSATVCSGGAVCNLRFDQAKKTADRFRGTLQLSPGGKLTVSLAYWLDKDRYDESAFGLTRADYQSLSAEADFDASERFNLYAYYNYETIKHDQRGRQSGATVSVNPLDDWTSNVQDKVNSFGGGLNLKLVPDKWTLDLSGRYQNVDGNNDIAAPLGGVPANARRAVGGVLGLPLYDDTRILTLSGELRYQFAKAWAASLGGWYEEYKIEDSNTQGIRYYEPASFFMNPLDADYKAKVGYVRVSYHF